MTTRMAFLALAAAAAISGCASLTAASAPSCDGSARRPLNRSLWAWENTRLIAVGPIETPVSIPPASVGREPIIRKGDAGGAKPTRLAVRAVFDIAASARSCVGADHG
jgi:type IV secretion system protein VirB7